MSVALQMTNIETPTPTLQKHKTKTNLAVSDNK